MIANSASPVLDLKKKKKKIAVPYALTIAQTVAIGNFTFRRIFQFLINLKKKKKISRRKERRTVVNGCLVEDVQYAVRSSKS